jgi:protein O-GlcNAc transferase
MALAKLGRHVDAAQRYAEAIQISPGWAQAHFLRGIELGQLQRPGEAEPEFREATRLMPDLAEARLNLGISLYKQEKWGEALREFEQVLERTPTNGLALQYVKALRERGANTPGR